VKNDQAQINYARIQLGYTAIGSPIAGRAGVRMIDAGTAPLPGLFGPAPTPVNLPRMNPEGG
jgi:hypothetical protein